MTDIIVVSRTQEIVVNPATQEISIINAGPVGPSGPKGDTGDAALSLNFEQLTSSNEWIINHNFGYFPNVNLYTLGGIEMLGQVVNMTVNQIRVFFSTPVTGKARIS